MEYSENFKNMVKVHQGKFIGYGNPNANILIIVPKMDDERLDAYNAENSEQWLANIENQTDFDDVEDFFVDGKQVGNESTFNPLYPFKGQRDILRKSKNGTVICNDGTSLSWHRYQDLFIDMQWDVTDRIDFFKYTFYTIYDEELLSHPLFKTFKIIQYSYPSKKHLVQHNPGNLFNLKCDFCKEITNETNKKYFVFSRLNDGVNGFAKMLVTLPYERVPKAIHLKNKDFFRRIIYFGEDVFIQKDVSIVKNNIDLLVSNNTLDDVVKRNIFERIMATIQINTENDKKWSEIWVYAFHNLKKNKMFCSSVKSGQSTIISPLPSVFATTSSDIVREIVSYIMTIDKNYWSIITSVLDKWKLYKWSTYELIPRATYNELKNIFEEIESIEIRTMLLGKLFWLKYEHRRWGLDY